MTDDNTMEILLLVEENRLMDAVKLLLVYDKRYVSLRIAARELKRIVKEHLDRDILTWL